MCCGKIRISFLGVLKRCFCLGVYGFLALSISFLKSSKTLAQEASCAAILTIPDDKLRILGDNIQKEKNLLKDKCDKGIEIDEKQKELLFKSFVLMENTDIGALTSFLNKITFIPSDKIPTYKIEESDLNIKKIRNWICVDEEFPGDVKLEDECYDHSSHTKKENYAPNFDDISNLMRSSKQSLPQYMVKHWDSDKKKNGLIVVYGIDLTSLSVVYAGKSSGYKYFDKPIELKYENQKYGKQVISAFIVSVPLNVPYAIVAEYGLARSHYIKTVLTGNTGRIFIPELNNETARCLSVDFEQDADKNLYRVHLDGYEIEKSNVYLVHEKQGHKVTILDPKVELEQKKNNIMAGRTIQADQLPNDGMCLDIYYDLTGNKRIILALAKTSISNQCREAGYDSSLLFLHAEEALNKLEKERRLYNIAAEKLKSEGKDKLISFQKATIDHKKDLHQWSRIAEMTRQLQDEADSLIGREIGQDRGNLSMTLAVSNAAKEAMRQGVNQIVIAELVCARTGVKNEWQNTIIATKFDLRKVQNATRSFFTGLDLSDTIIEKSISFFERTQMKGAVEAAVFQLFEEPYLRILDKKTKRHFTRYTNDVVEIFLPSNIKSKKDSTFYIEEIRENLSNDITIRNYYSLLFDKPEQFGARHAREVWAIFPEDKNATTFTVPLWPATPVPMKIELKLKKRKVNKATSDQQQDVLLEDEDGAENICNKEKELSKQMENNCDLELAQDSLELVEQTYSHFSLTFDSMLDAQIYSGKGMQKESKFPEYVMGGRLILAAEGVWPNGKTYLFPVSLGFFVGYGIRRHTAYTPRSWYESPSSYLIEEEDINMSNAYNAEENVSEVTQEAQSSSLNWTRHALLLGPTFSIGLMPYSGKYFKYQRTPHGRRFLVRVVARVAFDLGFIDTSEIEMKDSPFIGKARHGKTIFDPDMNFDIALKIEYEFAPDIRGSLAFNLGFVGVPISEQHEELIQYNLGFILGPGLGIRW